MRSASITTMLFLAVRHLTTAAEPTQRAYTNFHGRCHFVGSPSGAAVAHLHSQTASLPLVTGHEPIPTLTVGKLEGCNSEGEECGVCLPRLVR